MGYLATIYSGMYGLLRDYLYQYVWVTIRLYMCSCMNGLLCDYLQLYVWLTMWLSISVCMAYCVYGWLCWLYIYISVCMAYYATIYISMYSLLCDYLYQYVSLTMWLCTAACMTYCDYLQQYLWSYATIYIRMYDLLSNFLQQNVWLTIRISAAVFMVSYATICSRMLYLTIQLSTGECYILLSNYLQQNV